MNGIRVIFIHGISDVVIDKDYTAVLYRMLRSRLEQTGVIPLDATEEEKQQIFSFEQLNYSHIGHPEQMRLLEVYEQECDKLYNFAYRMSRAAGLDKIRRQIITAVSDVMVYKSVYWSGQIRGMVQEMVKPYIGTGDAVSIIAHSLGSVVAFDTIYDNTRNNAEWHDAGFLPANLFTLGSPIALFSLDLDSITGTQSAQYADTPPGRLGGLLNEEGVWYNFLDAQDLIAYPLEILFKDKFDIQDIVVQTGTNPRKAHAGYMENDEVVDTIAGRLKMDYQRINTSEDAVEDAALQDLVAQTEERTPA